MGASNACAPQLAESCAPSMRSLPQDVLQRIFQFADTHPLEFLAQLNLADVSSPHLPARGLLSFFYDTADMPWGDHNPEDATGSRPIHARRADACASAEAYAREPTQLAK